MSVRRDERGFVLITAMIVLAVFMVLTIAMVTIVDVQTNQSGHERSGEAAFELASSALRTEAYQLQVAWPATAAQALPACNSTTAQQPGCEGTALTQELQSTTSGPDYAHATWSAQAFDNTQSTYSPALASSAPAWDANGDNSMWVRAQATANGQTRTLVERVTRRLQTVSLPETVVTAGGLYTQSNGQPVIINAQDPGSGVTGPVDVRCIPSPPNAQPGQGTCLGWQPSQLSPQSAYQSGYVGPSGGSTLTSAQIQSLVQQAQAAGTLYNIPGAAPGAKSGCPPAGTYSPLSAGQSYPLVVVEGAGSCSYNGDWFSQANPGVLLFLQGSVSIGPGNPQFYGVLYMANQNPGAMPPAGSACTAAQMSSAPALVTLAGSATINGAVYVDGCGLMFIQDNGDALNFSANALQAMQTYGSATPAPGTFRVVSQ